MKKQFFAALVYSTLLLGCTSHRHSLVPESHLPLEMTFSNAEVVYKKRLSPKMKNELTIALKKAKKANGTVLLIYPENAPPMVMKEIKAIGVNCEKKQTLIKGYIVVFK